jgi:hypothetical protein
MERVMITEVTINLTDRLAENSRTAQLELPHASTGR